MDNCYRAKVEQRIANPKVCQGPGMDGFYHLEGDLALNSDGLRFLQKWGLLQVFGIEVLED